jgi:hypothetical protein
MTYYLQLHNITKSSWIFRFSLWYLDRRTYFYYEAKPGDKIGFPSEIAESMLYQYFRKY